MRNFVFCLLISALVCLMPCSGMAYVMPAEQLIYLMAANFGQFKSLSITQSAHLLNPQGQDTDMILEEKLWLKSPDLFRLESIGQIGDQSITGDEVAVGRPKTDMAFRRLFMGNDSETIMALLSEMGVNLSSVVLTRFDGVIAYRVGDKDPESPKLVIEKGRFLPLLLNYCPAGDSGRKMVTVRFRDYRMLADGRYPYEVTYSVGERMIQRFFILDLQSNVPINFSLSRIQAHRIVLPKSFEEDQNSLVKKRLREIIKLLKRMYR